VLFLETIKAEHGQTFHLDYHQRRLERTLDAFNIKQHYDLSELLDPPKEGLIRCRVLYDDAHASVVYLPYVPRTFKTLQAVIDDEIEYGFKYANRTALDLDYEARGECDEIVIVKNGLLTDTTIANIALSDGKRWVTPKTPLLHGTTRERLIDEGKLEEVDIPLEELWRYKRCALMNAMIGFVEIENGIIPPK
jgi:4-amino-4-deoxychorismate lyase